jgi:hypothetical protein
MWLTEEEATLVRLGGYSVTPYEEPVTFKTRYGIETGH